MKPLHVLLLLFALFITGLADGISTALSVIPGLGIMLALVLSYCINATMGSGLMLLLVMNGMYHPKFGPAGFIGGLIPGLDFLPFWLGVVIAGIVHDMSQEGGLVGEVAGLAQTATAAASGNVTGALQGAKNFAANTRPATLPVAANDNKDLPQERTQPALQTKNFDGISKQQAPRAANNSQSYVQKAA